MCRSPFFVYVELFTPGQNWQINQSTELLALKDQRLSKDMSRFLLNIAKRSLLRLMLGGIGLASKNAA